MFSQRRFDQQRHSNFVRANKRISGQFSHARMRITWTKEECFFNPGLRYSPVDTCGYLFISFLYFLLFIFLIFCLTRMARTMTHMARMARTMTRMARTMTRMARWLAC